MIRDLTTVLSNVSLSRSIGSYLADKSYGFDTIYFVAKFIRYYAENAIFDKRALKYKAIKYIEELFRLKPDSSDLSKHNYYRETINLLTYANILTKGKGEKYFISQKKILEFIAECPENAYVFLYLVAYMTLKNDGVLPLYIKYAKANTREEKEKVAWQIHEEFCKKSISIKTPNTQWSRQMVKYSLTILGYLDNQPEITRDLDVKDTALTIEDIALNIEGTRSDRDRPKQNGYLKTFNTNYVKYVLRDFILIPVSISNSEIQTVDSLAGSLAELKLAMLDDKVEEQERQQYLDNVVRTRNPVVQNQFRKELFDNNDHVCPLCGYSFEEFLIASHIRPYSKCEDTYDAINQFNGLLLCPNHDKLFEDAKYMTIEYNTGKVILSEEAEHSNDYGALAGRIIARVYINNERRHYLKWHNERFMEHQK